MNRKNIVTIDYRETVRQLIRTEYPIFFLGLFTVLSLTFISIRYNIISINQFLYRAKETPTPVVSKVIKHTVQEGEDLWHIAETYYGSGYNAFDIAQANKLQEPYVLSANQVLIIPSVAKRIPTQGEIPQEAALTEAKYSGKTYTVKEGDYLFQIAQAIYGDGNQMSKLIESNNIPYPYNVEVGQILKIPR